MKFSKVLSLGQNSQAVEMFPKIVPVGWTHPTLRRVRSHEVSTGDIVNVLSCLYLWRVPHTVTYMNSSKRSV